MALKHSTKKEANRLNINTAYLKHNPYGAPKAEEYSTTMQKAICATEEGEKTPWGKILKLFVEFIVAAATAFLTAKTGSAMCLW